MPPRPRHSTTNLPRALREELGLPDKRDESRRQNGPMTRKERRKAERSRSKGHGNNAVTNQRQRQPAREHDNAPKAKRSSQPQEKKSSKRRASDEELPDVDLDEPDDLLSESDGEAMDVDGDEQKTSSERHISRAVQEKLDEDDAEIARLEKKLGIKGKKKLPKAFTDDGLDELLADLDVGFEDDDEVDENDEEGEEEEDDDGDDDEQQVSNEKHIPRTVREKLDEDDAEIARLEKLLGIKGKKKLPKAFAEDGLDELLGDMGGAYENEDKKRKREGDEWLAMKRAKVQQQQQQQEEDAMDISEEEDDEEASEEGSEEEDDGLDDYLLGDAEGSEGEEESEDADEPDESEEGEEFSGLSDDDMKEQELEKPKRENPYVAPGASTQSSQPKYIPPSLRKQSSSESESMARLRRQAQGYLNKLSEANLVSILRDVEALYTDYPRQNVTTTLTDILFELIYNQSFLTDTFIILHAAFVTALYKVVGMDFGAEFLQRFVERFDADYEKEAHPTTQENGEKSADDSNASTVTRKEMVNAMSLLSHLYNFHMIGCGLVFDYIRLFLSEITELNTELLLKVIRNSGPQLRSDDPSSLKDIVLLIQPAVARVGEANLHTRTKFMIETITDLKNNRMKTGAAASSNVSSEHITRLRKALGSLNNSRVIRASEPLRIGRNDIHDSSKKGKWWLVGASWKNDGQALDAPIQSEIKSNMQAVVANNLDDDLGDAAAVDLLQLARAHRMNTDVRRSIFVAIMSASDYRDAHVRLMKLHLKRKQEVEIPRVLMHCAAEEDAYNPYYTLIARHLCGDRRVKMAFMFSLWDVFKRMGEQTDEDDEADVDPDEEGENAVSTKAIVNLAKMFANLIASGLQTIGVLKILNFAYLQEKTKMFVEILLVSIIIQSQQAQKKKRAASKESSSKDADEYDEKALADIFAKARDTPQIVAGLIYFIRKVVSKTDIVSSKREAKLVKWGSQLALDTLRVISQSEASNAA